MDGHDDEELFQLDGFDVRPKTKFVLAGNNQQDDMHSMAAAAVLEAAISSVAQSLAPNAIVAPSHARNAGISSSVTMISASLPIRIPNKGWSARARVDAKGAIAIDPAWTNTINPAVSTTPVDIVDADPVESGKDTQTNADAGTPRHKRKSILFKTTSDVAAQDDQPVTNAIPVINVEYSENNKDQDDEDDENVEFEPPHIFLARTYGGEHFLGTRPFERKFSVI